MTVSSNVSKVSTDGNGVTTSFPLGIDFIFFASTELRVIVVTKATGAESLKVLNADYTVTGGGGATGTVIMNVAPTSLETLVIRRVMPLTQGADLINNTASNAEVIEDALDRLTLADQQLSEGISRSVQYPEGETTAGELPAKSARASKFFAFDAAGQPIAAAGTSANLGPVTPYIDTLLDDTDAATARGTLGFAGAGGTVQAANIEASAVTTPKLAPDAVTYEKIADAVQKAISELVDYVHVDFDTGHRDLIRAGFYPAFFNQQWGGAPHYNELVDSSTGIAHRFEAATGWIVHNTDSLVANVAGNTWQAQGFKVSKTTTCTAVWVKINKIGNPANNLECRILPDAGSGTGPTGSTPITNGTATAQSGKLHTSDTNGHWVRFVFPTPPTLTANVFYHITLKSSGAADGVNHWAWKRADSLASAYPHSNSATADATPTWAPGTGSDNVFMVEPAAADQSLVAGGMFSDGRLQFFEGTPLNQSHARVKDLKDFAGFDATDFTLLLRGTAWTKDKTICDILYGLDHDRIMVRSNSVTGFAQVEVYDSGGTLRTVTATSVDLSSGNHDVAIRVRAKGDGSDTIALWVDGAANGTPFVGATIAFDTLFGKSQIGTMWIGGGFAGAPTWTVDLNMNVLPSAASPAWTWTGTATEANAVSVSGGKLYQNKNGYTSLQTGHYQRSTLAFSNTNGWAVKSKARVTSATNSKDQVSCVVDVFDGAKNSNINFSEYYVRVLGTAANVYPLIDAKTTENCYLHIGKGSDALVFANGRLLVDNSTLMGNATGSNQIRFGDNTGSTDENADAVWDYVKYYTPAWLPPQITSGSLSEYVVWNGDRTALLSALWNSGTPISVKQFTGRPRNWMEPEVVLRVRSAGITNAPTTTDASSPPTITVPELEGFVIGSQLFPAITGRFSHSLDQGDLSIMQRIDGAFEPGMQFQLGATSAGINNAATLAMPKRRIQVPFGLHRVNTQWRTGSGTLTATSTARVQEVESRA